MRYGLIKKLITDDIVCWRFFIKKISLFVCLTPLSTIFQLYRGGQFYWWGKTGGPGENQRPVPSHWQTLSHNIVHLALIEIRTHNRAPDKLRICIFYTMKTSKNASIIRSECTHYAYILLCKQTFQIRSVLVQSCT